MSVTQYTNSNLGLVAEWTQRHEGSFLCLVPNRSEAEALLVNLRSLHGNSVAMLPDWDIKPGEQSHPGESLQKQRLSALNALGRGELMGLVAPVRALGTPVLSPEALPEVEFDAGDSPGPMELARRLGDLGFTRRPLAEKPGEFALRGDLLDLFPESLPHPLRISFFGDEIESISYFHPNTQHQVEDTPETPVRLTQQSEFSLNSNEIDTLQQSLQKTGLQESAGQLEYDQSPEEIPNWFGRWPRETTWLENLLDEAAVSLYDPERTAEEVEHWDELVGALEPPASETYRSLSSVLSSLLETRGTVFSVHPQSVPSLPEMTVEEYGEPLDVSPSASIDARPISDFISTVEDTTTSTQKIFIHCGEDGFRERLEEHIEEAFGSVSHHNDTQLRLEESPWRGSYRVNGRARISLDDFFNRTISRGRVGPNIGRTEYLESFEDLSPGDLVVHEEYGIGRFRGLERVSTEKQTRDCIMIEYDGVDRVYLPPDQIAYVQKYIADSGYSPGLSSLTDGHWEKIKEGVEEEIQELAEELLDLYSSRAESETEGFPPDDLEQKQFEATFPHRETPDQQEAIRNVKQDMMDNRPMNRLICGDSGFGKTEVALRAAFKAVSDGRQVAMLVPTTVLARQHFNTFEERFSLFPYRVESLTRFRSTEEEREILDGLARGEVDVVIGTHRLLSGDVDFDELGLLIIDEEQRFGVQQKEELKFYREQVDVLTLSATPIPRTLYMSLSGIQDISQINTPPEDRHPVEINVSTFDHRRASEAVKRELDRGGQAFWISNRVKTIREETAKVREWLPEAEVEYAHGQMSKQELRDTMDRFYRGEIDVLVCTTIIEAGLDCPEANTMVIRNAHKFGLAQLYQLRGRIGRSHKQARAYLFHPEEKRLTEDAEARLETIKKCSELGAGFRVAMRDMEIRGAGQILGKDQHGNIRSVGFPLYCKLLQRSIRKLREDFEVPNPLPRLDLPGEHYIPEDYIPVEEQIIRQYQHLAECRELREVDQLEEQWRETFGPLPEPTKNLLRRHRFKIIADREDWQDIQYRDNRLNFQFKNGVPDRVHEASEEVDAVVETRMDRYKIRGLTEAKLHRWLALVTEEQMEKMTSQEKMSH
jgi:transcription-repair coupling factor (superfamily II helicase)